MKTEKHGTVKASIVVAAIATIVLGYAQGAHSCGLEPGINGGITISYPGSIDVAIAVAGARSNGLLRPASNEATSSEVRLQNMLADLRRLQARLSVARNVVADAGPANFSLVLVGPGLWSNYQMTAGGVLGNYHTPGPLADEAVVLTHATALHAMLDGSLSVEQASELGLIAYKGGHAATIRRIFETSLQAKT